MNAAHWASVERALDAVLEHDPAQWSARLSEICGEDDAVRRDVETLLRRYTSAQRFLDSPPAAAAAALVGEARSAVASEHLVGRRIGAWRVVRQIGRGGMSRVFLAERADGQFEQQVAVKLLHAGLDDRDTQLRFRAERQILAALTHPHIARLLDGGTTDDGVLYLAMEHVEGEPIDRYCDAQALSLRQRLELFTTVAEAVQYAHSNLVVHRDLKPSNILVSAAGEVKLLDFGIAKLLADGGPLAPALQTRTGHSWMTPGYAAPEQLRAEPVTTATDVYQLGAVLYELLTGHRPFESAATSLPELITAVLHQDAERPSTVVARVRSRTGADGEVRSDGAGRVESRVRSSPASMNRDVAEAEPRTGINEEVTPEGVSRSRGTDPERLRQALRGDLDMIVLKALCKEPERRYASAEALVADVRRHLAGEPVEARPGTLRYRATKFVRRNRTAVALAGLAALALFAGLAGTIIQARRATRQATLAQQQRDRADREARAANEQRDFALKQLSRAEAINDLNIFLISDAAPSGKPFTAGALLARAESIVQRDHAASAANRVEMLVAIGRQYRVRDEDAKARDLLGRAYEMSRRLTEYSTRAKAGCELASTLSKSGELERAEGLVREALAELPNEPQFALDRVYCFWRGSQVAQDAGNGSMAVDRAEAAQALLRQVPFPSPVLEMRLLMDLAESHRAAGRFLDAVKVFREAHRRLVALGRENTEAAGTLYNNWGLALDAIGQPLKAESLFRQAIRVASVDGGESSVSPMVLTNLARTLARLHRLPEAADYAERADTKARRAGDETVVYHALRVRASVYRQLGDLARADSMLSEHEVRLRRMLPAGHIAFARSASEQALLAEARGDLPSASAALDRAMAIAEAQEPSRSFLPLVLSHRSDLELKMRRFAAAERDAVRALELWKGMGGQGSPSADVGVAYLALGRALREQSRTEPARAAFLSALEHLRPSLGPDHPQTRVAEQLARQVSGGAGE